MIDGDKNSNRIEPQGINVTHGASEQVLKPSSSEAVAEIVRQASADGTGLKVGDGGSSNEDSSADATPRLTLDAMNQVVDYPARDMTITVQAGMTLGQLQETLEAENQQLPIDASPSTKLGALVAGDIAGSRQFGYGTLRDYLIGMEAVDGQGRIFHAGGRVVKNVAGYDLCRLMVGSRGTLGVLTQLTFKLKPLPEHTALRSFYFDAAAHLATALDRLNETAATPVILDFSANVAGTTGPSNSPFGLHIGVEGTEAACQWQIDQLIEDCQHSIDGPNASTLRGWQSGQICLRTLPSLLVDVVRKLNDAGYACHGHAGNGILFVEEKPGEQQLRGLCENLAAPGGGHVMEWDIDHPEKSSSPLSQRIRQTFDPHSVFVTSSV